MTDPVPRVSCLLPVYNGEAFLDEAVRSILGQTFADFEMVIVDDGSTDSTPDILAAFAAQDPRVRILRQANGGIVAALNAGLALCRGEFVARMDADDVALPDRFALQVAHLDAHPRCVLVGGYACTPAADGAYRRTTGGRHRTTDLSCFPPRVAVAMHPLITMRRAALVEVGGYSGEFPHAEDYDLFLRLSRLGSIDNPPHDMLIYRRHEGAISLRHLEQQERSAALAEARAIRAETGGGDTPDWVLEPYVKLRIWRRYCGVAPDKASAALAPLLADAFAVSPRTLASSKYWGLRARILGAVARRIQAELMANRRAA